MEKFSILLNNVSQNTLLYFQFNEISPLESFIYYIHLIPSYHLQLKCCYDLHLPIFSNSIKVEKTLKSTQLSNTPIFSLESWLTHSIERFITAWTEEMIGRSDWCVVSSRSTICTPFNIEMGTTVIGAGTSGALMCLINFIFFILGFSALYFDWTTFSFVSMTFYLHWKSKQEISFLYHLQILKKEPTFSWFL